MRRCLGPSVKGGHVTSELERALANADAQLLLAWLHVHVRDTAERVQVEAAVLASLRAARAEGARQAAEFVTIHLEELARSIRAIAPHMHGIDWPAAPGPAPPKPPAVSSPVPPQCRTCGASVYSLRTHACGKPEWPASDAER